MKEVLLAFANYTIWANNAIIEMILQLPEEKQDRALASSFSSLHKTLLHMLDASMIWWQRHKLLEQLVIPSEQLKGSLADVAGAIQKQDKVWRDWIGSASELMLQHEFIYYNKSKEKFKQQTFQMILHLFNHATYHRGQLVSMLRQLEVSKIPQTDFIVWSRRKAIP